MRGGGREGVGEGKGKEGRGKRRKKGREMGDTHILHECQCTYMYTYALILYVAHVNINIYTKLPQWDLNPRHTNI